MNKSIPSAIKYDFPADLEAVEYSLFPAELENDKMVFFHGTSMEAFQNILKEGFRPGKNLSSVSYSSNSSLALEYACKKRSKSSPDGCVIAIRFAEIPSKGSSRESFGLYVYDVTIQPVIIGYCVVPDFYIFN